MTDFEKLCSVLTEIGVPFELTDDSEECGDDKELDTVILLKNSLDDEIRCYEVYIMFRRDGSFKEIDIV